METSDYDIIEGLVTELLTEESRAVENYINATYRNIKIWSESLDERYDRLFLNTFNDNND